ncbi:MAG: CPBP family intramembrane metalloprotease [Candidatus Eisenbacteria bacterium]|uniref:CPBP family intramembrane metalloprotease n=1 Tax=Eiseniibacteriota bacterium TaxID=2212470 RepID=A0A9D6QNW4_UNCEI|nr:CPBP family intramembrane metalloprotease [Candidatus Eisenbacteria bacterium]MBI3539334.1 CPBP family intramembrane metalloprotease [Candidatus Eisenbacteria bacterium]
MSDAPSPDTPVTRAAPDDDGFARALRGFGPTGLAAVLVILLANGVFVSLNGALVLLWAWRSRTPWRALGFVRPASWPRTIALGVVFGAAFKLAMKALVMPMLGADPINRTYHFLAGNPGAAPGMLYALIAGAGFGEETVFRGFLFERLGRRIGTSRAAALATVAGTALLFAAMHLPDQGLPGAEQAVFTGLAFGAIYARTRALPLLMIAHAAFDLAAYALIYWSLETRVAHWVFR